MIKKSLLVLVLLLPLSAFAEIDSDMDMFTESIATVDDASAGFYNPAGLGINYVMSFRYLHSFSKSSFKGDNGGALATNGNMVAAQWLKHSNGVFRRKFIIASGKSLVENLYWGLSFAYFNGSEIYKGKKVWKLGIMYHPSMPIWFGLTVDDLNRPKFGDTRVERLYTVAAAYKDWRGRGQLSIDVWNSEQDKFRQLKARARLELSLKQSYHLAVQYMTGGEIQLGLAIDVNYISLGVGSRLEDGSFNGGNFYYNQRPVEDSNR